MSKYENRLRKLEAAWAAMQPKVWIDYDPEETERERARYLTATRGGGAFVVIPKEMADL